MSLVHDSFTPNSNKTHITNPLSTASASHLLKRETHNGEGPIQHREIKAGVICGMCTVRKRRCSEQLVVEFESNDFLIIFMIMKTSTSIHLRPPEKNPIHRSGRKV